MGHYEQVCLATKISTTSIKLDFVFCFKEQQQWKSGCQIYWKGSQHIWEYFLFGFLNFLWLTCKAPSQIGDLNQTTKFVLQAYSSGGSSWVLDSECTNHMTRERSMFWSYTPKMDSNENILFGDNSKGDVIGFGKVAITLTCWFVRLQFVVRLSIMWDGLQLSLYG